MKQGQISSCMRGFKEIWESGVPMSAEMHAANQIWYESPQTTKCLIYLFCTKISNGGKSLRIFCFFLNGTQVFATVITSHVKMTALLVMD